MYHELHCIWFRTFRWNFATLYLRFQRSDYRIQSVLYTLNGAGFVLHVSWFGMPIGFGQTLCILLQGCGQLLSSHTRAFVLKTLTMVVYDSLLKELSIRSCKYLLQIRKYYWTSRLRVCENTYMNVTYKNKKITKERKIQACSWIAIIKFNLNIFPYILIFILKVLPQFLEM